VLRCYSGAGTKLTVFGMILLFLAVRKSWPAWFTGKTLPKLYRFFTDFSFREVKTGPKLTVSGTIFQFVRKIGPKLTEIGMNFNFGLKGGN
jgi:hypothetical protein